ATLRDSGMAQIKAGITIVKEINKVTCVEQRYRSSSRHLQGPACSARGPLARCDSVSSCGDGDCCGSGCRGEVGPLGCAGCFCGGIVSAGSGDSLGGGDQPGEFGGGKKRCGQGLRPASHEGRGCCPDSSRSRDPRFCAALRGFPAFFGRSDSVVAVETEKERAIRGGRNHHLVFSPGSARGGRGYRHSVGAAAHYPRIRIACRGSRTATGCGPELFARGAL